MENVKNIQKIDIHAHAALFREYSPLYKPDKPESKFVSPEQLIEFYDKLGIEKGVLLPIVSAEGQTAPMTSEACKYITVQYPDRFFWFCNVDPRAFPNRPTADLVRLIEHYKSLGALGVGEITALLDMDDPKVDNLFAACEKCDMPVMIHISQSYEDAYGLYDEVGLPRLEKVL